MNISREGKSDIQVATVVEIAKSAGQAIMEVYSEDPDTWDKRSKSDDTPVTKADMKADDIIRTELLKAYPDIPIISEESEHLPYEDRRAYEYCWIVDPLDGTKEFIKRSGDFAVMIGLCFKGKPVLGVVHAPDGDVPRTYYAVSGKAAFVLEGNKGSLDEGRRISARAFGLLDAGLRLAVSASRPPEDFIATCKDPKTMRIGSAGLKAIAVAEGKADVFPCFYSVSEWDTCATQVIVEEAGGTVVRYESPGKEGLAAIAGRQMSPGPGANLDDLRLQYNKEDLSSPPCLFLGQWHS